MRTVNEFNVDYVFKKRFGLKQPHELSEKQRQRYIEDMGLASEMLTVETFTSAASKMGISYCELFFMALPRLRIFMPIVLSDYFVTRGHFGFIENAHLSTINWGETKQRLEEEMEKGDFEPFFWNIDKRGRHMAYFKLFDRIPNNQKFDIFLHNLESPGRDDIFRKGEINEILSYKQYSDCWNRAIQSFKEDYGKDEHIVVYQPEFGIYKGVSHDFYWELDKEKAVRASHEMGTNGRVKKRMVHILDILDYGYEDKSIQVLPEHTMKIHSKPLTNEC